MDLLDEMERAVNRNGVVLSECLAVARRNRSKTMLGTFPRESDD
jgi:hypothetical protein